MDKYYKNMIYRGIPENTTVWTGDPVTKHCKSPSDEGFYDLYQIVDKHFETINYKWEKSSYTKPEVFHSGNWYPTVSANFVK